MKIKKRVFIYIILIAVIALSFACGVAVKAGKGGKPIPKGSDKVFFGQVSLSDFTVVTHNVIRANSAVKELNEYAYGKTGEKLKVKIKGGKTPNTITLVVDKEAPSEKILIAGGNIVLYGTDSESLTNTVRAFANMYLGYEFAGESRQKISKGENLSNPGNVLWLENAWIKEREPIICLWKTNVARGQFFNTSANLDSEILTYSDAQLYEYVRLMKACGFTGIQVTDMCSAWAQYSGYEFVHDRLRFMADAAHSLGMKFTLWVWGAEFNGYGWIDDTVVYADYANYDYSFECPEAYATFEKYYDIYAELADCSDRVIMHFDDPSNIHDSLEIATYAKLYKDKVRAINPDIDFGISDYTNKYDKAVMAELLGEDTTVYAGAVTSTKSWNSFRGDVKNAGLGLGVWSWNLGEMEIDQFAWLNVNPNLIKRVYLETSANGDEVMKPDYWSEMDSYHIGNVFSLYAAGHLLQNPMEEPDELLMETAAALVGDSNASDLYEILKTIEMARTGDKWETFKWTQDNEEYLLWSKEYPAKEILDRCNTYGPKLQEMAMNGEFAPTIPMPVSVNDLLKMIRPHLEQIKRFAEFRLKFDEIEDKAKAGTISDEELKAALFEMSEPVPNFDTLIGVFGQPEAIAQYKLINDLCLEQGIDLIENPVYKYYLKQYLYEEICAFQKQTDSCLYYSAEGSLYSAVYGVDLIASALDELKDEGLLMDRGDGSLYLTNWEEFTY